MVTETAERQKIIYVVGVGHCGTTWLGILFTRFLNNGVCLGEIEAALRETVTRIAHEQKGHCTCGELTSDCEFWSRIAAAEDKSFSTPQRFQMLLENFQDHYPGKVMIDTSKFTKTLDDSWLAPEFSDKLDIRFIHLVRDYRGWSLSRMKAYKNKGRRKSLWRHCIQWWLRNDARARYLEKIDHPVMTLSYESLIFDFNKQLERISEFTGMEILPEPNGREDMHVHDCHGNTMRLDPKNFSEFRYDYKWLLEGRFGLLGPLLWPVHRYWKKVNDLSK